MDRLFGIPTGLLATGSLIALAAVLAALGLLAWRQPLLVRLGLRAVPRRRLRTVLIVLGLTTSTAVIATAIGTGETMAATIRALVAGGIGPVDEVITLGGRTQPAPGIRDPQAVLAGGDLAAGEYFAEARFNALAASMQGDRDIAALEPSIQLQATAVGADSGRARTGVNVLGLRPGAPVLDRFLTTDGSYLSLADLAPGEVLINEEAARLLDLAAGTAVQLQPPSVQPHSSFDGLSHSAATLETDGGIPFNVTVRAVVRDGGLIGVQPAVILPLSLLQERIGRPEQLNQILVVNQRGGNEEARSRAVTGRLRFAIADRGLLDRAARGLSTEAGQGQLRALENRVRSEARDAIGRVREAARSGQASPELAYFLADPLLTSEYRWLLGSIVNDPSVRGQDVAAAVAPMTVLEVKQRAIDAANEYGSAVTTVFLILGLFSIAASLLLVFLIFVMLAAERRTEMGLTRAVGAQRHHLVTAFAVEGLVYDLLASVIGLALGVGIGALVLRLLQGVFDRYDVTLRGHMSGGGVLLSFSIGALVTFGTVLVAAWKVSRVNIIAAIHGLPDDGDRLRRRGMRATLPGLLPYVGCFAAVLIGGLLAVAGRADGGPVLAAGGALLVLAAAFLVQRLLLLMGLPAARVRRLVATVAGPVIAVMFALSPSEPFTVRSDEVVRQGTAGFVLAGLAMAGALVWAAGANLDVLLAPVRWLARPFGGIAPATRIAVAYPLTHPFRTGLTAAMFALVFLVMVAATALLRSTEEAYVRRDGSAGFDIRVQFSRPPDNLEAALSTSASVRRDDFTMIGGQAPSSVETLWPGEKAAAWRPAEVRLADANLLGGFSAELTARAQGFADDASVWRALRDQPGTAILSRRDAESLPAMRSTLGQGEGSIVRFEPVTVWVRDPRGGTPAKLRIIGVTVDGSILPRGMITARAALAGAPASQQPPVEFFFRAAPNVSLRDAATGIALTFPDNGVRTRVLGDVARTGMAVRNLLDTLIRGFLGMGLVSGIAALGVIGMRSVAERRQQIGMLRALGLSRRSVQASFLIEGSVVAILGITVGGIVGLILARNVVAFLARDFRQLHLLIPWGQIAAIAIAAYSSALLSALAVAWQAGRVSPAEALRYE